MAMLQFDANEVEPETTYEPLPPGWYVVEISGSEMKQTKAGTGEYLQLELTVLDGEHAHRKLWDRLNIRNPNEVAMQISKKRLSAICQAIGLSQVTDSTQLHGKPLEAKIAVREASGQYGPTNDVKGYRAYGKAAKAAPAKKAARDDNLPAWA